MTDKTAPKQPQKSQINIKIQGKSPQVIQIEQSKTINDIKKKLFLTNQQIIDMNVFFNGKVDITDQVKSSISSIVQKYGDLIYLDFKDVDKVGGVGKDAIDDNKNKGFKQLDNPALNYGQIAAKPKVQINMVDKQRQMDKIMGDGKGLTDVKRLNDKFPFTDFMQLMNDLKVFNGRFLDPKKQVKISDFKGFEINLSQKQYGDAVTDPGQGSSFMDQTCNEFSTNIVTQGYNEAQLKAKIPFIFSMGIGNKEQYYKSQNNKFKNIDIVVQHRYTKGIVNFRICQFKAKKQLATFFDKKNITMDLINKFYQSFGQYHIKKFSVGLKRVCKQTLQKSYSVDKEEKVKQIAAQTAANIKQYMAEVNSGAKIGSKQESDKTDIKQKFSYKINTIGGEAEVGQNIAEWKKSFNNWKLWRIISVQQIQSTLDYLPDNIKNIVQNVLSQQNRIIEQQVFADHSKSFALCKQIKKGKQVQSIKSDFTTLCQFKQRIRQIFPYKGNSLILLLSLKIGQDKLVQFDITKRKIIRQMTLPEYTLPFPNDVKQSIAGCVQQDHVYFASNNGIFKVDLLQFKFTIINKQKWSMINFLTFYNGKLYSNGFNFYQINPNTGQYVKYNNEDWRCYVGTRIGSMCYLIFSSLFCFDLQSKAYTKINNDNWNDGWGYTPTPTNDQVRIWHVFHNALYLFAKDEYRTVEFCKGNVKMNKFSTLYLSYMNRALYLNHHDGTYDNLMCFPLQDN